LAEQSTIRKYRGFVLDPFQAEAIDLIDANKSVLVSAPTGVGKTLIADYIIEKIYRSGDGLFTLPDKSPEQSKIPGV